jgi:hypothetical protein
MTTTTVLRTLRTICTVAGLALLATARFIWAHRAEIRAALVRTLAAFIVATELAYRAGCWTRRTVEAVNQRSAALLPQQPLPAVAPITATVEAAREALARLIARLYPQPINA